MIVTTEMTDLFCGEANYGWVRRESITLPGSASDLAIVRAAKASVGLSGCRGRMVSYGDGWEFRPYGMLVIAFISITNNTDTSMI
jgi:hypothetical protein